MDFLTDRDTYVYTLSIIITVQELGDYSKGETLILL